jgi:hypothetical protein
MMFKIGCIYKHINCLDVCFKIQTIQEKENGDLRLLGLWLNQHYDMLIICDDDITITKDRIHQWKELNENTKDAMGRTGIHNI